MDSLQYTGANDEEVQAFTGGEIKRDPMDGAVLISADKLSRNKVVPGNQIMVSDDGKVCVFSECASQPA